MRKITLLFALLASLPLAAAKAGMIAADLRPQSGGTVDVLIQFNGMPTEPHHQAMRTLGGKLKASFGHMAIEVYTVPSGAIAAIAQIAGVTYISPDRQVKGQLDYTAAAVNATMAWKYGWTGDGIGIAIIDSGIAATADLFQKGRHGSRVVYAESFGNLTGTADQYGHGNHVAGIAAGDGGDSSGRYQGIAPKANLLNLRVLDGQGGGSDSAVIAAIDRAIELKSTYNVRILNLSLGRPVVESYQQDPLCRAVEAAWKAGIIVVAAAGNDGREGYGTIDAPGNDPYVITVGAMKTMGTYGREDDQIASYSGKGPTAIDHIVKPDIVAPGNRVVSDRGEFNNYLSTSYPQNIVARNYFQLSGTSMATPVVSGAAALLLEQDGALTPDQVKARLMKTAGKSFPAVSIATDPQTGISYTSFYDPFTVGAGYLDINAALNNLDLAQLPALSPEVSYDAVAGIVSLAQDKGVVWGSNLVWSMSAVWGKTTANLPGAVWGSIGTDTTSGLSASGVIWGDMASVLGEN
jgi:serine protease AprX